MKDQLNIRITDQSPSSCTLELKGVLDESTRDGLFELKAKILNFPAVKIDTGGILRANSVGIAHFIRFITDLSDTQIEFEKCSQVFADVAAMIPSIIEHAKVSSFYGAFYCPKCDDEVLALIELSGSPEIPPMTCKKCGKERQASEEANDFAELICG